MNPVPNTSKYNVTFEDIDVFEDSALAAKFNDSTFHDSSALGASRNLNTSGNKSSLNVSALCCDEEISGYDKLTGKTWIYPTNYSVRDYQFNIIKAALLKNTLVSLPTGLGKTFIAAVVMYNFFRWYPLGKIVFTAPTRPLVAQQIDACYNIVAIPPEDTIEMTGNMQANTRKVHWKSKRVFFATPQVIYNDIKSGICPSDKIRCLVIDEAHRARGNYAYGQIVGALEDLGHKTFRLLALSATPGSKVEDVVNVVKRLQIAHLELRTDECIDVAPYSPGRRVTTVVVPLGRQLEQLRHQYIEILDTYARRLKQLNILPHYVGNLSKGRIVMLYKEYQTKERGARHPQHNYIMKDFTVLIALYHGLELLTRHGSRVFLNFFDEHPEKSWIQSDDRLTALLERLRDDLGTNPLSLDRSMLPDGTIPEIPKNLCFGHPKFEKLRQIIMDHFNKAKENGQDTRAIVFCEYRESVNLVHCLLLQCRPLVSAQMFVGQGAAGKDGKAIVSQKQQLRVMRGFREGTFNVLVATCVAEEGLDVGSVDLIICFDISTRSPVRLVQRCGRTGRERGGQVHILVTEGKEHQTLLDCMRQRDGLNRRILQSAEVRNSLYKHNPRMMPHGFTPECQKMYITVEKKEVKEAKGSKGQLNLRKMLTGRASSVGTNSFQKEPKEDVPITKAEFDEMFPEGFTFGEYFDDAQEYWCMNKETLDKTTKKTRDHHDKLSTWLEWQKKLQNSINVGHSSDSEILVKLLQSSDAKKFDMPEPTQNPTFSTQDLNTQVLTKPVVPKVVSKKKQKGPTTKPTSKNDGDIRALFSTATKSTKNYTKLINDLGIQNDGSIPTSLIDLLVDFTLETSSKSDNCCVCTGLGDCSIFQNRKGTKDISKALIFLKDPKLPDLDLIDDINPGAITECMEKVATDTQFLEAVDDMIVSNKNVSKNFDLEFDFGSPELDAIDDSKDILDKNFDVGDIEDIFDESSPEEATGKTNANEDLNRKSQLNPVMQQTNVDFDTVKQPLITPRPKSCDVQEEKDSSHPKEALEFFGLDSIDDIFADSDNSNNTLDEKLPVDSPIEIPDDQPEKDNIALGDCKATIVENDNTACSSREKDFSQTVESRISQSEKIVRSASPSILSGAPKVTEPTSPILCSQRMLQSSTNRSKPSSSTPVIKSNQENSLLRESMFSSFKLPNQSSKNPNGTTNSVNASTNKSMFTITQLVEMINKSTEETNQKNTVEKDIILTDILKGDDRSTSPILQSQVERNKSVAKSKITPKRNDSLIILDSDSDSDDTVVYNFDNKDQSPLKLSKTDFESPFNSQDFRSPLTVKRKFDDESDSSPYFSKRQKTANEKIKPLTLQEKIIAALNSNDAKTDKKLNNENDTISMFISPILQSQKENRSPLKEKDKLINNNDFNKESQSPFEKLQMFRRDKSRKPQNGIKKPETLQKRIEFDDSDDDFVTDSKRCVSQKQIRDKQSSLVNHKMRKKKPNQFLDLEAELSQSSADSGDELTDESVGSIIDFICDQDGDAGPDMYAHYAKSVKSVPNGQFKIPELPQRFNKDEIFSQFVEEDHYEMDSFCVESHMELTQANDLSELELAEQQLEKRRKAKRKGKSIEIPPDEKGDSPLVKRVNRKVKRQISSDSDSS